MWWQFIIYLIFKMNDLFGLNNDGTIKGETEDLVQLFKAVYTPKSLS